MNAHQHRLWSRMLRVIDKFRDGTISFPQLVGELEGAVDAGEFRDSALVERFYDIWEPLEITNAVRGDTTTYAEVATDVAAMQDFLLEHLAAKEPEES